MSKQTLFTMKLEPELHAAFKTEAEAVHRPASQIVRELMRDFVTKQREARDYEAFLQQKVQAARDSLTSGMGLSPETVEAAMTPRRRPLTDER